MSDRRFRLRWLRCLRVASWNLALLSGVTGLAAQTGPFRDVAAGGLPARNASGSLEAPLPRQFRALEVDAVALSRTLQSAAVLELPYPDGTNRSFRVEESSILEPALRAKFPDLRTYLVQGIDDPSANGRVSFTPMGFHAMVLSSEGTVYIDPYRKWEKRHAISYWKRDARKPVGERFSCGFDELAEEEATLPAAELASAAEAASGTQLRTYRLALAGTVEYTTAVCAPNPVAVACGLNGMVVSMNRVNGIYEREVAVRMVLVANNNLLVFTAENDGYSNGSGSTMLGQNQTKLDTVIGSANYDVGHVFSTGGGGVASLNVPCVAGSKARGVTGRGTPIGDAFDVDYVAHEMGHQFGGPHTFNGTTANCGGVNRSAGSAYEPGSGSTIQAYAGICGAEDLQPNSDDTFHTRSFDQLVAFTTGATGSSCPVITATGNAAPIVDAGPAYTIPRLTPFTLTGSATDPNGDALTYMWEEFDLGTAAPPNTDAAAVRPIFRSFVPRTIPSRTFPQLTDILNNFTTLGESMSQRDRVMTFRMTARDNRTGGGGVDYDSTTVTVHGVAGPFTVTQPDTALSWMGGTNQTVTWNVANTTAAPVSCANVAIELSTDGGNNFTAVLAASTANDGSEIVLLPNTPSATARVRISCVGNVFFDISNLNFTITAGSITPPPNLVSILPISGSTSGGTAVTLTGADFVTGALVHFDGLLSPSITFNSSTSLTASTPAHAPGAVTVSVTNPDAQMDSLAAAFTYTTPPPAPTVTNVVPSRGSTLGGTSVAITGTNFVNGATVTFGSTAASSVTFGSSTSLTAVTAPRIGGLVGVTVTNPDAQSGSLPASYTYAPIGFHTLTPCRVVDTRDPPGPLGGPALGGGATRIFGVVGVCGVPAGASAVALNVTVVNATATGELIFSAAGTALPFASTISFNIAETRANNAIVGLQGPTPGSLQVNAKIPSAFTTDLVIDVVGFFVN